MEDRYRRTSIDSQWRPCLVVLHTWVVSMEGIDKLFFLSREVCCGVAVRCYIDHGCDVTSGSGAARPDLNSNTLVRPG